MDTLGPLVKAIRLSSTALRQVSTSTKLHCSLHVHARAGPALGEKCLQRVDSKSRLRQACEAAMKGTTQKKKTLRNSALLLELYPRPLREDDAATKATVCTPSDGPPNLLRQVCPCSHRHGEATCLVRCSWEGSAWYSKIPWPCAPPILHASPEGDFCQYKPPLNLGNAGWI